MDETKTQEDFIKELTEKLNLKLKNESINFSNIRHIILLKKILIKEYNFTEEKALFFLEKFILQFFRQYLQHEFLFKDNLDPDYIVKYRKEFLYFFEIYYNKPFFDNNLYLNLKTQNSEMYHVLENMLNHKYVKKIISEISKDKVIKKLYKTIVELDKDIKNNTAYPIKVNLLQSSMADELTKFRKKIMEKIHEIFKLCYENDKDLLLKNLVIYKNLLDSDYLILKKLFKEEKYSFLQKNRYLFNLNNIYIHIENEQILFKINNNVFLTIFLTA